MIAAPARTGNWIDTDVPCSLDVLTSAHARGYQGVLRYVPLPGNRPAMDISAGELERIVACDLQCGLVQHVRAGLWDPGHCSGTKDAQAAIDAANLAAYPHGGHMFLDLESISGSAAATLTFVYAWQAAVIAAGFKAGVYVGFGVPLSPEELYELPGVNSYWSDAARRQVATRGCAIVQGQMVRIAGTEFDQDIVAPDALDELPYVATPEVLAA